jgi:hypothetical protein
MAHSSTVQACARRRSRWIFRIAQNLWFDQNRGEKIRGEPMKMADYQDGGGPAVTERRLVLADLLRALDCHKRA